MSMKVKAFFLVITLFTLSSCNPKYNIGTSAMLPNYEVGDVASITQAKNLTYGDVILYYSYIPLHREAGFHRIMGLPGDTIMFQNQQCIINGDTCKWKFIRRFFYEQDGIDLEEYQEELPNGKKINIYRSIVPLDSATATTSPTVVPTNNYFVVGDYRDGSVDSRWEGTVPIDSIIGKSIE